MKQNFFAEIIPRVKKVRQRAEYALVRPFLQQPQILNNLKNHLLEDNELVYSWDNLEIALYQLDDVNFDIICGEYLLDKDGLKRDKETGKIITGDNLLDTVDDSEDFDNLLEQLQNTIKSVIDKK